MKTSSDWLAYEYIRERETCLHFLPYYKRYCNENTQHYDRDNRGFDGNPVLDWSDLPTCNTTEYLNYSKQNVK